MASSILPLLPVVPPAPVFMDTSPLLPDVPPAAVDSVIAPLSVAVPTPVVIVTAPLDLEHTGPEFFRREALLIGEITNDFYRVSLIQPCSMKCHHTADGCLPTFWGFAHP